VALSALLQSKFRNAGQACIASNRVLVQAGVYEEFAGMVAEAASRLQCGTVHTLEGIPVCDPGSTGRGIPVVGPLIDANGLKKVFIC
jgi:succinate-semialdehyde dehydrogenase/glutarate-semialdehyde dehydrogenase